MACRYIRFPITALFITCIVLHTAETATVVASVSPSPAVKGVSSPHTVYCNYSLSPGENFRSMYLVAYRPIEIFAYKEANNDPQWLNTVLANSLRQRGNLSASDSLQYFSMTLRDTQCSDSNQTYECLLYTNIHLNISTTVVPVEVAPLAPVMKVIPASDNVTEFTTMTFECEGNVGRPAGTFQWYIFIGNGQGQEVTDQAQMLAETASGDGCTFSKKSQLKWNMTRTDQNKPFVVRCRVNHPAQGNQDLNACSDASVDFCRMSPEISIRYPVSVSVASDTVTAYEGTDLTIHCLTDGNPDPDRVDWQKEGENEILPSSGGALTLYNVTSDDQGSYRCTGYNTIEGSSRHASVTVFVTVEKTTTLSTTSTALTNADTGSSSGSDNLLGPVLGSVLGVVLAINAVVVAVVCWRRYSQGKDTALSLSRTLKNSVHSQSPSAPVEETNYYNDINESQHNYDSLQPYQNEEADRKLYSQLTSHPVSK